MSHRNHPRTDAGRNDRDTRQFQPQPAANYQGRGQDRSETAQRDFAGRMMDRGRDWDSHQDQAIEPDDHDWRMDSGSRSGNQGYSNHGYSGQGYGNRGAQGGWQPAYRSGQEMRGGYSDWQNAGPHTGKGPKGYQRSDDRIREDVSDQLTMHGDVDASLIEVDVKNGEVTLRGTVDSRQAKRMAEDTADGVSGVRQVNNQLRVMQGQSPNVPSSQGDGAYRGSSMDESSSSKRGKGLEH